MKQLVVTIALILFSIHSFAQKGFEVGVAGQFQNTWIFNDNDLSTGPKLDYKETFGRAFGLQLGFGFNDRHGIRVGVFQSTQGQNYITSEDFIELPKAKYFVKQSYLNIPVLYRYVADLKKHNSAFVLHIGPQFGLLQKSTSTAVQSKSPFTNAMISPEFDSKENYNSMDISAVLGVGTIFRLNKSFHINTMINLAYSVVDIEKADKKFPAERVTSNHGVVGFQLGLYYLIGGPDFVSKDKYKP